MTVADDNERQELVDLVKRIRSGSIETEEDEDRAIADFVSRVPHPRSTDLIFHPHLEFDRDPTAEEIVDRALSYRALDL